MSIEESLSELAKLADRFEAFSLVFGTKNDDEYVFKKVGLVNGATECVRSDALAWIQSLSDLSPEKYQVGTIREDTEIHYIETSSVVGGVGLISQLTPTTKLSSVGGDEDFLDRVSLTALTIVDRDMNQATLLRRVTNAFLLRRSGTKFRLRYDNGVFNEVSEEIVHIDREYDCIE